MPYRSLTNEINISDMVTMRDSGMTMREIAAALGIAQSTVSRYLSTKTEHKNRPVIVDDRPAKPTFGDRCEEYLNSMKPVEDTTKILAQFEILSSITTLKGSVNTYVVDTVQGTVELTDGVLQGLLDRECIDTLIEELKSIKRRLA